MANIVHSVLAGTEVHEPKGVSSASLGQVYVADGNGSGNWSNVGTSSFTGMIADFTWPVVQDGWLECDGSDINITTYGALFAVMTIQMTGSRITATNTITSLSSTSNMRVGYYIYGTGIPEDTKITTINSGTQVTMSANASSTGTSDVIVSPWRLGNGVIRLPNLSGNGYFRRSRTASTAVGQTQSSQNLSHTHSVSGTAASDGANHYHNFSGYTGAMSANASHTHVYQQSGLTGLQAGPSSVYAYFADINAATSATNIDHTHSFSGATGAASAYLHTHRVSGTAAANGGSEARPNNMIFMTCVKT